MLPFATALRRPTRPSAPTVVLASGQREHGDGSAALVFPAGVRFGDLLLCVGTAVVGGAGIGGAGYPYSSAGIGLYRALRQGDLTPGALTQSGPGIWALLRGPRKLVQRQSGGAAGAGPLVPGFTKARNSGGVLLLGQGNAATTAPPSSPAPFFSRQVVHPPGVGVGFLLADILNPATYVNGASVAMGGSSNGNTTGYLIEMLR